MDTTLTIQQIDQLVRAHQIVPAFRALLPQLYTNDEAQMIYLELLRTDWNLFAIAKDAELLANIERGAKERDMWLMHAFARYHDAVRPEPDSRLMAAEYYHRATYKGIADALAYIAILRLYGEYGVNPQVDIDNYIQFRDTAAQKGSYKAIHARLLDMAKGQYGFDHEPLEAYKRHEEFVTQCEERGLRMDPYSYTLLGRICEELGRVLEADMWYNKGIEHGDSRAYYFLAMLRGCGKDQEIVDRDEFMFIMREGMEKQVADTFLAEAMCVSADEYKDMDAANQQITHELLQLHLEKAVELGEPIGALFLSEYYQKGTHGFKKSAKLAKEWKERGAMALRFEALERAEAEAAEDEYEEDDSKYDAWS